MSEISDDNYNADWLLSGLKAYRIVIKLSEFYYLSL